MANILLIHVAATLMMTGLIWLIQCVHYPLFEQVGVETFADYHVRHTQWITPIVGPLMLVELVTAVMLVQSPPSVLQTWQVWAGLGLILTIWASTALLQIPLHNKLGSGPQVDTIRELVRGNWIRTVAWTLRSGLALWWVHLTMKTLV